MVKFIDYKGKKYPVRVSYLALKMVSAETGKQLSQMDVDKFDPEVQEKLLFWALKSGAFATGETMSLTVEEMEYVLDECFIQFTQMIPEFFTPKKDAEDCNEAVRGFMKILSQRGDIVFSEEQKVEIAALARQIFEKGFDKGFTDGEEKAKKEYTQSMT